MPRNLFHQRRQGMLAEPVYLTPQTISYALAGDNREFEPEMRETMMHGAGERQPVGYNRGKTDGLGETPRFPAPWRRRNLDHASEQTLRGPLTQQHGSVRAREPECDAVSQRSFRLFGESWQSFLRA